MFKSARLKLTAWYLLIIMVISISFSAFIYYGTSQEFDRILRVQRFRIEHPDFITRPQQGFFFEDGQIAQQRLGDPEVISEARLRVLIELFGINVIILLFSSLLGYFLAGRTLRPIKEMIDEQNRFVSNSSHELNTPLTSLKTTIEVNLRDKNLGLQKAKSVLESNLEDVNNLQSLSDKLIKLTKYQEVNGNFKLEKVFILDAINLALGQVRSQTQQKQVEFKLNVPKLSAKADLRSMVELFVILFDNAIKYSKSNKQVIVKAKKFDSKIEITVQDHGIGISKEDLPHIFDRFYRAEKSRTKQQADGYGLGLSIAKRIVSLHNGSIDIESNTGQGVTVKISLSA